MATRSGERKNQILQVLAEMLEAPKSEKITTAALAERLDVSEAALYRHFASKAQMYEGLIGFVEETVFGLINKISTEQESGLKQTHAIASMLLSFAEKNPGEAGVRRCLLGGENRPAKRRPPSRYQPQRADRYRGAYQD